MGWTKHLAWWGYQGLLGGAMLLAGPVLFMRRRHHYAPTLKPRLGLSRLPDAGAAPPLWIHAVSVGEVMVAATLAKVLPAELPLLVTTVTPTGQQQARKIFAGPNAQRSAEVAYLPFDLGIPVDRFLDHFNPRGLILVEGDYWPLVLHRVSRRGIPVAVVNGRVGARAARRQQKIPALCRKLFFEPVHRFAVQTERDQRRLVAAGAPPERIQVTGNLKFDSLPPDGKPELESRVRGLAGSRPIVVAGSTMQGEDEAVIDAFQALPPGRALLILAPRHPERAPDVLRLAQQRHRAVLRSAFDAAADDPSTETDDAPEIIVLDTLGELAALYRLATLAFIGGTLVPTGGHNPLEPAHFAKPIVVGPSMDNFKHMAQQFDESNAWRRAADRHRLGDVFREWLDDPDAARAVGQRAAQLLHDNRGATLRTWDAIRPVFGL